MVFALLCGGLRARHSVAFEQLRTSAANGFTEVPFCRDASGAPDSRRLFTTNGLRSPSMSFQTREYLALR
jgi:hypothetical protein